MEKTYVQNRGDRTYAGFFIALIFAIFGIVIGLNAKSLSGRRFSEGNSSGVEFVQPIQTFWTTTGLALFVCGLVIFVVVFHYWLHQDDGEK